MSPPLLMIPGPIEVSPAVVEAFSVPPPSHLAPDLMDAFGRSLERMRAVWCADAAAQPFIIPGSGSLAMEVAATNLVDPGDRVLQVSSGYFGERMATMLRRRGADVEVVSAPALGGVADLDAVASALRGGGFRALFATHVDTSTGARVDAEALSALAREHGCLSVFDGVCSTAAERFEMHDWGADVYLTGSQKAIGLPAGLALLVFSPRAMEARAALKSPPPMSLDVEVWRPIMEAYEARSPSYFATPATNLIMALDVSLGELLDDRLEGDRGMAARFARHHKVASAMRAAWRALDLTLLPVPGVEANTMSAIRLPAGVDASLPARVKEHGVVIAGGLHPDIKKTYFRVGHMGDVVRRHDALLRTVDAVAAGLADAGHRGDAAAARAAASAGLN
ncbi:MAG: alanine--glyoxylate aminotransferase family protein [Myxococcota bacterium]